MAPGGVRSPSESDPAPPLPLALPFAFHAAILPSKPLP